MKQVDLPLIEMSTGLSAALTHLRKSKRSALLSESQGEYHLFTAGNIAAGRSRGIETLSDLKSTAKLKLKTASPHVGVGAKKTRLVGEGRSAQRRDVRRGRATPIVGRSSARFVLGTVARKSAFLGIRSADMALRFFSGPKDLYCDGPNHHDDFPPPDVSEGDPCPHHDGHTIVSAR